MASPATSSANREERVMSDEELDRDWQPSGRRPKSTMARSFSAELMNIFRIENSVADLDEKIDKRKQNVQSQTSVLESLQARLEETEAMLKRRSVHSPLPMTKAATTTLPVRKSSAAAAATASSPQSKSSMGANRDRTSIGSSAGGNGSKRPTTGTGPGRTVGGNLPPSPVASDDERGH